MFTDLRKFSGLLDRGLDLDELRHSPAQEVRQISGKTDSTTTLFGSHDSRSRAAVPEELKFFIGVALTLWLPTLMACYVIGQALPIYVLVVVEVLGVLIGVLIFKQPSDGLLSCSPIDRIAKAHTPMSSREVKRPFRTISHHS
jgi:hypothetical protein